MTEANHFKRSVPWNHSVTPYFDRASKRLDGSSFGWSWLRSNGKSSIAN